MSAFRIVMEARDPNRNQARAYAIDAGYDLFGDFMGEHVVWPNWLQGSDAATDLHLS